MPPEADAMERFGGWLDGTAIPALINTGFAAQRAFQEFASSEFAREAMADLGKAGPQLLSTPSGSSSAAPLGSLPSK